MPLPFPSTPPALREPPPRRWWLWVAAGGAALAAAGAASALLPERFAVTAVDVAGARPSLTDPVADRTREIIDRHARLFGRTTIFLVPRARIEDDLPRAFPAIHTVQVLRQLPGTVRIVVQEKVPVALLFAGGTYYALDPDGRAFEEVAAERLPENTLPILRDERRDVSVELGATLVDATVLSMLHDLVALLPARFGLAVHDVTIPAIGTEEFRVRTNEGWTLLLDATRPLDSQFAVLEKIFAEDVDDEARARLEYMDLRVRGKAFYRVSPPHASRRQDTRR